MKDSITIIKGLFDVMDELDEMFIENTGHPSPYRLSPEAEEIKNIIQDKGESTL